jgi:hypothetical protein
MHLVFDELHYVWECKNTQHVVNAVLLVFFIVLLGLIELKRNGLLPAGFLSELPTNPFYAVYLTFSLLLVVEVINLIFVVPESVSRSVGKQLEILILYFLRNAFKELIHFTEPINLTGHIDPLLHIGAYGLGALLIFICVSYYYRQQFKRQKSQTEGVLIFQFVGAKKAVGLMLLLVFLLLGGYNCVAMVRGFEGVEFFAEFFTILVFGDILLVLISQPFFPRFVDMFRNSGYAIATLLMRLSMTGSGYLDVVIGVGAALFALLLAYAYRKNIQALG